MDRLSKRKNDTNNCSQIRRNQCSGADATLASIKALYVCICVCIYQQCMVFVMYYHFVVHNQTPITYVLTQMDTLDRQIYDQQYTVLVMDYHFVTGNQTQMTYIPTQMDLMMIAFITISSGLVPLIEGLCAQILYFRFELRHVTIKTIHKYCPRNQCIGAFGALASPKRYSSRSV